IVQSLRDIPAWYSMLKRAVRASSAILFFFKQKTAYDIGLGIPAEPLFRSVGFYVAKYVNKKSDMDLAAKGLGAKEWNNSLKTKLSLLPKKLFRIRMSHNFGMKMLTMTNLSTECLIQLTKLGYDATPFNQILKQNAKREMRLRLGKVTVADVLAAQPDDKSAQIYARFDKNDWRIQPAEFYRFHDAEVNTFGYF